MQHIKHRPKSKTSTERPKSGATAAKAKNTKLAEKNSDVADILAERINLVTKITSLEDEARDVGFDTTPTFTENVLPSGAEDMGSGKILQ